MANRDRHTARDAASNSLVIMICTLASRLLGIVKARAIATVFGATGTADVINFTFNIPNNFRKLFAEGALSSAYIPVFTAAITKEEGGTTTSRALLARMQGFQLLIVVPLVLLTWIWREQIIVFLSDFSDPASIQLFGELIVYFMIFLGSISFAALYGGVLQSHGSFFTAAAAPLIFSLSVIGSVYVFSDRIGAYSMALGVVVGGVLQAIVTYARLRKYGYAMLFSFNFVHPEFQRVMKGWAPVTITAIIAIVTQQIAFYFASSLSEGTVTAFSNAIILWQAPYGIVWAAIPTLFVPAMVSACHRKAPEELGALIAKGMLYIATFLIPAALVLTVLRNETTAVLLQSGRFTLADTFETGRILVWFSIGMPIVAWYGFMQRVCFSTNKFTATLVVGIVVSVLDICTTWLGIRLGFGSPSLSFANSFSYGIGILVLWGIVVRKHQAHVHAKDLILGLVKLLTANIPLATLAFIYVRLVSHSWWHDGSTWSNAMLLMGFYSIAILSTVISYRLAGIEFISVLKRKER